MHQDMDMLMVFVHNVQLELILQQEVPQHVNNVTQMHGQTLEQHHALLVRVVLLVLDQQVNVLNVMLVMDMILQIRNVQRVHHYIIQQEERWYVQNVIHYVKHVMLKQVIV